MWMLAVWEQALLEHACGHLHNATQLNHIRDDLIADSRTLSSREIVFYSIILRTHTLFTDLQQLSFQIRLQNRNCKEYVSKCLMEHVIHQLTFLCSINHHSSAHCQSVAKHLLTTACRSYIFKRPINFDSSNSNINKMRCQSFSNNSEI